MQGKWAVVLLIPVSLLLGACSGGSFDIANLPIIGPTHTSTSSVTPTPSPTSTNTPTPTPTSTSTLKKTSTPTNTSTPTLTPTPYGGGNGEVILYDKFSVYRLELNDSTRDMLLSAQDLIDTLSLDSSSGDFLNLGFISPDGNKILIQICKDLAACRGVPSTFLVDTNLTNLLSISIPRLMRMEQVQWHPDSKEILAPVRPAGGTVGRRGYPTYIIDTGDDNFGKVVKFGDASSVFWSSDNHDVFYFLYPDVFQSDNRNISKFACDSCIPKGPMVYAGGSSIGGKLIAFGNTYGDLFLMNEDFSKPITFKLLEDIKDLEWSPDGRKILFLGFLFREDENSITNYGRQIAIFDIDSQNRLDIRADEAFFLCNWSPDSRLVSFLTFSVERKTMLHIFNIETQESQTIHSSSCPVWLQ